VRWTPRTSAITCNLTSASLRRAVSCESGGACYRVLELVETALADVDLGIPSPFSAPLSRTARINAAKMSSTTIAIPTRVRHDMANLMLGVLLRCCCSTVDLFGFDRQT
jgi:hypothetical protein